MTEDKLFTDIECHVRNIVRRKIPDQDIDDVIQDICLNIWKSFYSFEGKSAFSTWYSVIAKNGIVDYYRRKEREKKHQVMLENHYEDSRTFTTRQSMVTSPWDALNMDRYVDMLTDNRRNVILEMLDGKNMVEIAREQDLSYESVRSRYRYAVGNLRDRVRLNRDAESSLDGCGANDREEIEQKSEDSGSEHQVQTD